jgi:ATP-dependent Clp protease ATP-binding subunit ClpC
MAASGRRKRRRDDSRSRGERIREFVFGKGGLQGNDRLRPERPDSQPLYNLAQQLDEIYQNLSQPQELVDHPLFLRGVEYLAHPGFSTRDLMLYAQGDNEIIGHLALMALAGRAPDGKLRRELLAFMGRVSVWRRFFILEALLTHVPASDSLVGEICLINRELHPQYADILHTFLAAFLETRLAGGEILSFGGGLEDLNAESIGSLELFLARGNTEALEPLVREISQWRKNFVDRSVLREAGCVWGEAGHSSGGPVIEHPELISQAEAVMAGLDGTPRRSTLIIGEPGSGKTALMRAVGRRLERRGWLIFEASGQDLVAGQTYMGQFEERLKAVVAQISGQRKALWYVPDFGTLQAAGQHKWSRSSALDKLLPLVESGQIVMIGELRPAAFEKIAQDRPRSLTAFDLCRIAPLDETATLDLARGWIAENSLPDQPPLVGPEVLREAWLLTGQYLQDRAAPGNLMDFLKLAASRLGPTDPQQNLAGTVGIDDLIATLSKLTGLPAAILDDRQQLDTGDLRRYFSERIMGQPEAVDCVIDRIGIIKAGLADPTRPQGVFLFAGPTGTGKTEIGKALASYLFGSDNRLIRLDMSEFQNPAEIMRLTGNGEPGDNTSLAARVRKQPFSVILLDEFEKAHPRVWDLFLQVFDDGRLTDSLGRTTDFRHSLILLTSNLGSHAPAGGSVGFDKTRGSFRPADVDKAIGKAFRREFLNRLDRVVVFRPLGREAMRSILVRELRDIQRRRGLRNRNWEVVWEESATDFLLDKGFSPDLGARPLKRAVERYLLTPLAETIVQGRFPAGDQFLYIHAAGDRLKVEFIDPNEPETEPAEPTDAAIGTALEAGPGASLAGIALAPAGTPGEIQALRQGLEALQHQVESPAWKKAKELALSMMSVSDFWTSVERFTILGEVEYRERVENGLKTTSTLLTKLSAGKSGEAQRYSRRMAAQVAERLVLLDQACLALNLNQPWEALLSLEVKSDTGSTATADRRWLARLRDMYLGWASKRKIQVKVLQDAAGPLSDCRPVLMAFSGFAALSLLETEQGLHIWEEPSLRGNRNFDHQQVLVRVGPQPEELSGIPGADLLPAARSMISDPLPGAPVIVRYYREMPDPLVKDRIGNWRTGRLDRVLGGDFDLLGLDSNQERRVNRGQA